MKDEDGINKGINEINRNTKTTDEIVKQIVEDRIHGSSWILIQTIKLLKKIKPENRAEICRKISSSHPAMAGLRALSRAIAKNPLLDAEKVVQDANSKTSENLSKLVAGKIVTTLSRSHIVENGLVKVRKAIILESLPGGEGKDLATWLKSQREFKGDIILLQDATMGYAVRESDFVVVGADSIYSHGFVNKVGSLPLALTSKHFRKPFVVAAPSYKFLEGDVVDVRSGTQSGMQSLFEFVNMDYVNFVVWESGIANLAELGLDEIRKASANFFQLMG